MDSFYDKALSEVGNNGYFQKKFDVTYNVILVVLWAMVYTNIVLVLAITPHTCELPENPTNISDNIWRSKYIPMSEDINGQLKFDRCFIYVNPDQGNDTKKCDKYTFDKTWYESTVASDNNWVCDKELFVANVNLYTKIGEIIGSLLFGWFGDVYGRRLTYIIALSLLVLGRALSIFAGQSFIIFVIGCIVAYLPSWSAVQSTTVISLEISSPERRSVTVTLRFAAYSFGVCLMSLLYWILREWKLFFVVTTLVQLPYVLFSWKLIESPRWLWLKGDKEGCIKQLKHIAKANKTKLEEATERNLLTEPSPEATETLGFLSLFSGWKLATNTSLQLSLWVCVTLNYAVLLLSSGEKSDGNPFLEFASQAVAEFPAFFIGAFLVNYVGRRKTGVICYGITAVMWMLVIIRESSVNSWVRNWWVGTALVILIKLSSTVCYYTIELLNMELYPTCLRQSGMSLGSLFSSGAFAVASYIIYVGRNFDPRFPGAVLIMVSLIGSICSYLLPETLNAKLPETIEEAREFRPHKKRSSSIVLRNLKRSPQVDQDDSVS